MTIRRILRGWRRREILVFVSSPGDCHDERALVAGILEKVNRDPQVSGQRVSFQPLLWEQLPPGSAEDGDFQKRIDGVMRRLECDSFGVYLGFMKGRVGTPTPRYRSGTAEEFETSLDRRKRTGSPAEILFYFLNPDADRTPEVVEFRKSIGAKGFLSVTLPAAEFASRFEQNMMDVASTWSGWRNILRRNWRRMRLVSGVAAAVTLVAGVLIWQANRQTETQRQDHLREQSRNLARAAEDALSKGEVWKAYLISSQAVDWPGSSPQARRPTIPEAVRVHHLAAIATGGDIGPGETAWSEGGHWITSDGALDAELMLWSAIDERVSLTLPFKGRWAGGFSPDGRWIVQRSDKDDSPCPCLWSLDSAPPRQFSLGKENDSVVFAPASGWLLAGSPGVATSDGTPKASARLWDLRAGEPALTDVTMGEEWGRGEYGFSPDARWLSTGYDERVSWWNLSGDHPSKMPGAFPDLADLKRGSPPDLISSPDNRWLLKYRGRGGDSEGWYLWDIRNQPTAVSDIGPLLFPERGQHEEYGSGFRPGKYKPPLFSPDSRWMVAGGPPGSNTRIWDLSGTTPAGRDLKALCTKGILAANARWMLCDARLLNLEDLSRPDSDTKLDHSSGSFSPQGLWLISKDPADDRGGTLWDLRGASPTAVKSGIPGDAALGFSPDDRWLSAQSEKTTQFWRLPSNPEETPKPDPLEASGVPVFSPAGDWIVVHGKVSSVMQIVEANQPSKTPSSTATSLKVKTSLAWPANLADVSFGPGGKFLILNWQSDGKEWRQIAPMTAMSDPAFAVSRAEARAAGKPGRADPVKCLTSAELVALNLLPKLDAAADGVTARSAKAGTHVCPLALDLTDGG